VENPFSWSVSRHDAFSTCERKYYYSYYASVEDPEIKRLKKLSALPLWAGNVVHQTIENFLKTNDRTPSPTEQEALSGVKCYGRRLRRVESAGSQSKIWSLLKWAGFRFSCEWTWRLEISPDRS
jgi:ATP-dependent helicase/DNAse subunit B